MMLKNILVYTDGEVIGDGIIKIPFAATLKKAFPDARLTWLCGGDTVYTCTLKELASPIIDEIIVLPAQKLKWAYMFGKPPLNKYFDIIIDTQTKVKRSLWLYRIQHGAFLSASARYLLSSTRPSKSTDGKIFDKLMLLASLAAGKTLLPEKIELPFRWKEIAEKLLPKGKRYIGFVPGASQPFKCWPLENFLALAQRLDTKGLVPVIFLGPQEEHMVPTIRATLPEAILPLSDVKDPCLTIALGQKLTASIANDSGGGHLIAAGGSPIVSLFRSSSVRKKFIPSTQFATALAPEDFGGSRMDDIPLEAVAIALEKLL
ncbi:MAG: glycosyltransferase family 9 protein [Alphaproteobacteria bacterium]|nr:glycosyltransferase family 9 protein [Alphaproteobacteria bacterium]